MSNELTSEQVVAISRVCTSKAFKEAKNALEKGSSYDVDFICSVRGLIQVPDGHNERAQPFSCPKWLGAFIELYTLLLTGDNKPSNVTQRHLVATALEQTLACKGASSELLDSVVDGVVDTHKQALPKKPVAKPIQTSLIVEIAE